MDDTIVQSKTLTVGRHIIRIDVHRIPLGWRFYARRWGGTGEEPLLSVASQDLLRGLAYTQQRLIDEYGG